MIKRGTLILSIATLKMSSEWYAPRPTGA